MRILDAGVMTVKSFCELVTEFGDEIATFNGRETIIARKGEGFKVRTCAAFVYEDMLGIRIYW